MPAKQGGGREEDHASAAKYGCSHAVRIVAHEAGLSPTELYGRDGAEASGLDDSTEYSGVASASQRPASFSIDQIMEETRQKGLARQGQ